MNIKKFKSSIYDIVGSLCYGIGIESFVKPANIAPGGISGVAIILNFLFSLPIGIMIFIINIPIIIAGFYYLSKRLMIRTLKTLVISTIILDGVVAPFIPQYVGERLLGSVFGGIFMGIGLGIVFMNGSTTGGTDILSYIWRKKVPHMSIGKALMMIDFVILILSMLVFRDIEAGLYGMISLFCCTRVIDSILYGTARGNMVLIISKNNDLIINMIFEKLQRGVTIIKAMGGYSKKDENVLMCVVSRPQFPRLKMLIKDIDPDAFLVITQTEDIIGEGFAKIDSD